MRFLRVARGRAAEAEGRPGEAAWTGVRARNLLFKLAVWGRGCAREARVAACGVVVTAARRVGEGVVGIVDLLESFGAGGALGRVGGDAVWVVLQGCSTVGGVLGLLWWNEAGCGEVMYFL